MNVDIGPTGPSLGNALKTDAISYAQFVEAYQALAFANCQGLIVDASLDVTWGLHNICAEEAVWRCHAGLLASIDAWLAGRGLPVCYIWVLEVGATLGLHTHMTLHLPEGLREQFAAFLTTSIAALVGGPVIDNEARATFKLQVAAHEFTFEQWRRFRYMLKSTDPWADCDGRQVVAGSGVATLVEVAGINYEFGGFMGLPRLGVSAALSDVARGAWAALPDMTISAARPPHFGDGYLRWHEAQPGIPPSSEAPCDFAR